ncbi:phosphoadenosine phosphosulfate reductase family protein [Clostridium sp. FP1]|uniref:phosphoadenosine phosphosulfate reductase domain-containing protein n=1 Tax=Clostridium sp. FP1 TaxID=2724076 RepID=UPI0013E9845B|nr:phosphoadenosine phosphosulfate reductase family protein [Clostridium sp. FP1]MBZ9634598.1 phosphoadenosine phosphosulfate reductase family protein [Clostridium sp. FP1]
MIKYHCEECDIDCETSECSVCGLRTEKKSTMFWCKHCNVPIYEEQCSLCGQTGKYMTTDLRPVFPEERLLLEILIGEPFKYENSSVWNGAGNRYIIDGEKLRVSIAGLMKSDAKKVVEEIEIHKNQNSYKYFNENIKKFIEANRKRLNSIVSEAMEFTKKSAEDYGLDEMFISFSGGKDSTVIQDLVVKALSKPEIIHIFGDTTLEFPMTMEYMKRFRENNRKTPMITAKNKDKNFESMCEIVGPPSRVMRWCCIIFKTGAITRKIDVAFKNKKRLLTFYGIRRSESTSRNRYEREADSPKITKQKVVSPIIDWYDFDIWLYILTTGIDFNDAYRLGYSRVGCWCCPNNSLWAQYLSSIYMPDQYKKWRDFLISFATKIGKPDAETYVDEGKWKARQGGNGIELSKNTFLSFKPCATEEKSFNYELKRPITEQIYELFKPFGWISKEFGNERLGEVFVVDRNNQPLLRIQGKIGTNLLKVSVLKLPIGKSKSVKEIKSKIECQLTKYQMCIACLACESACRHDAISIKQENKINVIKEVEVSTVDKDNKYPKIEQNNYKIIDEKCVRCGECVNHFDSGCYMKKVLITKRGE